MADTGITPETTPDAERPARRRRAAEDTAPTTTVYRVFRAEGETLKPGDTVTYLGDFAGATKTDARWAAVDADPALAEAVKVPEGQEGGVFLIPVAERMAQPERTVEEIVQTSKRR